VAQLKIMWKTVVPNQQCKSLDEHNLWTVFCSTNCTVCWSFK